MRRRMLVMFAALAVMFLLSGLRAQAQARLFDPNEPGSVLVFPKFVRGTVAAGVPATEIEISAHCPIDAQPCATPGTSIRLMGHWVCPGQVETQICKENNFIFATTVEGTVLNIVNWGCNVIAPVIAIACLGVAGWHFKSGRGYMGWGVTGVALMVISGLGRMAEGFITQAQGIN